MSTYFKRSLLSHKISWNCCFFSAISSLKLATLTKVDRSFYIRTLAWMYPRCWVRFCNNRRPNYNPPLVAPTSGLSCLSELASLASWKNKQYKTKLQPATRGSNPWLIVPELTLLASWKINCIILGFFWPRSNYDLSHWLIVPELAS